MGIVSLLTLDAMRRTSPQRIRCERTFSWPLTRSVCMSIWRLSAPSIRDFLDAVHARYKLDDFYGSGKLKLHGGTASRVPKKVNILKSSYTPVYHAVSE